MGKQARKRRLDREARERGETTGGSAYARYDRKLDQISADFASSIGLHTTSESRRALREQLWKTWFPDDEVRDG